jgi:hypothetical protein
MTEHTNINANQKPYMLLVLVLIPIVVVLAASFVFYTGIGMPKDTRNKGVLITPPQQINDILPLDMDGKPFVFERKKGRVESGTFLTAHTARHAMMNVNSFFWMKRQTRIALGQYQEKVRRVWLVTEGKLDGENRAVAAEGAR